MTTSMYGTPLGFRTYEEDQAKLQQYADQSQLHQAQTARALAHAGLYGAQQAGVAAKNAAMAAATAELQDAEQAGAVTDMAGKLDRQARAFLKYGLVEDATKAAKAAGEIRKDAAQVDATRASEALRNLRTKQLMLNDMNALYAGVRSPKELAAANLVWQSRYPDEPIPKELQTYNPAAIDAILRGTEEGLKRVKADLDASEAASRNANRANAVSARNERVKLLKETLDFRKTQEQNRLNRTGGEEKLKDTKGPGSIILKNTDKMIKQEFSAIDTKERGLLTYAIAADAKARMRWNKGLNEQEAVRQAIDDAKLRGEIVEGKNWLGDGFKYKPGTAVEGKRPDMPLPLPATADPKKLQIGRYYSDGNGGIKQWRGIQPGGGNPWNDISLPKPSLPGRAPVNLLDDDEDDDTED